MNYPAKAIRYEIDNKKTGQLFWLQFDCERLLRHEAFYALSFVAGFLRVWVHDYQLVTAEKTSYTYISGDTFEDGIARKVMRTASPL